MYLNDFYACMISVNDDIKHMISLNYRWLTPEVLHSVTGLTGAYNFSARAQKRIFQLAVLE